MRIAFVDMFFSWPPHGGGDVDMYHVMAGAAAAGHDIRLFITRDEDTWERGCIEAALPFPQAMLSFSGSEFQGAHVADRIKQEVSEWKPDAVFVGQGLLMKPYILNALSQYPLVSRYHAHEAACLKDILRFRDNTPCPKAYLKTPETCRACAFDHWGKAIRRGEKNAWLREYTGALAWKSEYYQTVKKGLEAVDIALVYNTAMLDPFMEFRHKARVIPSGVDTSLFTPTQTASSKTKTSVILMAGRAEDPAKGYSVLSNAAERLWKKRQDFQIWATLPQDTCDRPWIKALGWLTQDELRRIYGEASLCVVPSLWEEPFGIVALEAMASGKPVIASRVGGLQEIVADHTTGNLFTPGAPNELAAILDTLLDQPALRHSMGEAARKRVIEHYDWKNITLKHYHPLWMDLFSIASEKHG